MPTYEYECESCGLKFDRQQAITDPPLTQCPQCSGQARRLISGGTGFVLKGAGRGPMGQADGTCSLEQVGKTCCGRDQRCEKPPCG